MTYSGRLIRSVFQIGLTEETVTKRSRRGNPFEPLADEGNENNTTQGPNVGLAIANRLISFAASAPIVELVPAMPVFTPHQQNLAVFMTDKAELRRLFRSD